MISFTITDSQNAKVPLQDIVQQSIAFEYDDHFEQLLDELGIREVIGEDDEALRTMWNNLKVGRKQLQVPILPLILINNI